jgi:hypothetical protein
LRGGGETIVCPLPTRGGNEKGGNRRRATNDYMMRQK